MLQPKLYQMLGANTHLPRVLCSDRGLGFYQTSTGYIVEEYHKAVRDHGFRTYAGEGSSQQPADMADFWPHETAVSWVRSYMKKHPLKKGVGMPQMEQDFVSTMDATP